MTNKLRAIFCGTPDFSVPTLEMLHHHPQIELVSVVTMPDRPAGRGHKLQSPPVAQYAQENGISLLQTDNINEDLDTNVPVDFILVLAFAQIFKKKLLNYPGIGCFNIHTSLLPKYRGAAPIQHALLNGDRQTGVSIQKMVKQLDAGDIVHTAVIDIASEENLPQLCTRLKFQAALSANEFVGMLGGERLVYTPQGQEGVSYAPTINKEDGHIDFVNISAPMILNKLKALSPWPGIFFFINGKRVKIIDASFDMTPVPAGQLCTEYQSLLVGCQDSTLRLQRIQIEGKKVCSDLEMLNGWKGAELSITPGVSR